MSVVRASTADRLALADWRRRIATLYAEVRSLALDDPEMAHLHWRGVREHLLREHPQSPIPPDQRRAFEGRFWPYDPAYRFEINVKPAPPADAGALALDMPNSGSDVLAFSRFGSLDIPLPGGSRRLSLFWMDGYASGVFVPFRDATNGRQTYGAGRYLLDGPKSADLGGDLDRHTLILDFNFAYQPSCAFDPRWACPLAPPENRLDLEVRAGERIA